MTALMDLARNHNNPYWIKCTGGLKSRLSYETGTIGWKEILQNGVKEDGEAGAEIQD